ncbi:MAG: hypothetical protein NT113_12930 [Hyphomicrobiales bacterium]|nr:hypothetical protein [Hyphomicrobiales bacterium]
MLAIVAGIVVCMACAMIGRTCLRWAKVSGSSLWGGAFVIGYGICSVILLLSLKYLGRFWPGQLVIVLVLAVCLYDVVANARSIVWHQSLHAMKRRVIAHGAATIVLWSIAFIVIATWIVSVALVYLPVAEFAGPPVYGFPDVFDLPKQLLAQQAAYHAKGWPVANPFYGGEPFTYNLLFYLPAAMAARIAGSELANFGTYVVVALAVAVALVLTLIEGGRRICRSDHVPLIVAALATWVGGLTPLFVASIPPIGFSLFREGLIRDGIWIDDTFIAAIFVPQHVLATLLALTAAFALATVQDLRTGWRKILMASSATVAGALTSLILLPHILLTYLLNIALLALLCVRRDRRQGKWPVFSVRSIVAACLPMAILLPFVLEAREWSSDVKQLFALPKQIGQWGYVIAAFGVLGPLSMFAMRWLKTWGLPGSPQHYLTSVIAFVLVGIVGLLFTDYPDSGIKSGLWLRIALVLTALAGLEYLVSHVLAEKLRGLVGVMCAVAFIFLATINFSTVSFYVRSASRPLDENVRGVVAAARALPVNARVALLPPDQVGAAMIGRLIDFNVFALRSDGYLPPSSRASAKKIWDDLEKGDAAAWRRLDSRYDYVIVSRRSPLDKGISDVATVVFENGSYRIFSTASIKKS